jgi:hypothetical protein
LTNEVIDEAWSQSVAAIAADALVMAKLLAGSEQDRAKAIIAEEIYIRLIAGDRPDRENWKYKSK